MFAMNGRLAAVLMLGLTPTWRALADIPRPEHPDPMAVRPHWENLNGNWEFRFDAQDEGQAKGWFEPGAEGFDKTIVVPFPWESRLSGVKAAKDAPKVGWYRRTFRVPAAFPRDQRVWMRFGAVDWRADVWVNGKKVGEHDGGYTPFELDISDAVKRDDDNVVVVRAHDPTDPSLPTGKQIGWYTTTSGIWQTVWLEARPKGRITSFGFATATLDTPTVLVNVLVAPAEAGNYEVSLESNDPAIGRRSASFATTRDDVEPTVHTFVFPVKDAKLWSPESPHLYDVALELKTPSGAVDRIESYFGIRTVERGVYGNEPFERILLNGKPIYLRLALDQSFNPEGIYTAPTDEFLRKDIELAKSLGLNGLRIHIKPDEPRRLYWADKLGLLIMEDMPNTWKQDAQARKAWEATMREVLVRDRNHPAVFSWVAFNETWGLGAPEKYKQDRDTQGWVKAMVGLMKTIDPTRLVEDNSPCNYDHVAATDLNSWHFYIDDHAEAKRHIEEVVEKSAPGSSFNYCPGEAMNSAPLINSEYGAVSAGGGDRDVSWGFRDLTTQLRKHNKIQGYVYTELSDIEWEHNGFVNYDRTPKTFGYDAFVPGMTVADLQGADFVGYDSPPVIVAAPGETMRVPLFVSHYSERSDVPVLRWSIGGMNEAGDVDRMEPRERPIEWTQYGVTAQKPIAFRIHGPFVGALALELVTSDGQRLAANFVNIVVKPETHAPRVERVSDHEAALRLRPDEISGARWSGGFAATNGKAAGKGEGAFTYKVKLPDSVTKAKPKSVKLRLELSAKADREKVAWAERRNAQDYPQTDARKWPTSALVTINGAKVASVALEDDPADARGVLSHLRAADHGSHGYLIDIESELPPSVRHELAAGNPLVLRLQVPDPGSVAGGLAIYGVETGAYPYNPTLFVQTENDLPADLGIDPRASPAVDTIASRTVTALPTGESDTGPEADWAYTTETPGDGWEQAEFDDSSWKRGRGGFGTEGTPGIRVRTPWSAREIWLRTSVDLPELESSDRLVLRFYHDEDLRVIVNGKPLHEARGYVTAYRELVLDDSQRALFHPGTNQIVVHCRQSGGGQGVDVGLIHQKGE